MWIPGFRPRSRRPCLRHAPLLAAIAFLAAPPPAPAAGQAETPPVALRTFLFLTPVETAGSGVAPEVKVRVTVDERGRVRDPEVVSIEPSSVYDDYFREAAVESLARWRYAPATVDGAPVEKTLEWSIKFRPKARRSVAATLEAESTLDQETRLGRVFTLPPDTQAERLRNFASLAEKRLDASTRRRVDSQRFIVVSDASEPETAATIAGNLEAVYGLLDELFRRDVEPRPAHYKLMVYLYARRDSFEDLTHELVAPEWVSGLYVPPGLLTFHLETGSVDTLLVTMIHEAVHAYVDQHLARPGFQPPPWLSEGLAEYFGESEIRKGKLVPGALRAGKYVHDQIRGGAFRKRTEAGWSLGEAKRAVRAGRATPVTELVSAGRETFYGEDVAMHYALSWLLVHFLRHGEPGWAEEEFPNLLLYASEGYPAADAIEAVYGRSPADLEVAFRAYVRSL